ncbi:MAG: acyloxyacyl hydrolase [Aestuariibacter sp.]|uniref:acyloxyacyl hydrolase n=1 Tax=Marisediminitalea aggregata TaxID=634436 RepID=UPI0020CBE96B|nr:acyloxyacyl hydrolase [Marisediminitalea aggregata]MCP3861893.1 acyloxyacyl hydrolase [Aestuariibacter sp.]MCP4527976.1 acyloxyacyl hydrolase [Aestuariibacter sp.]MCP4947958.1 acyloxyacyl hydrolase [Aestuariibacter sp.]MCP9476558.1 acyloxyacyl hydrolase [Marisediminitalea aggregata]
MWLTRHKFLLVTLSLLIALYHAPVNAFNQMSVDVLKGEGEIAGARIGVAPWSPGDYHLPLLGKVVVTTEFSLTQLEASGAAPDLNGNAVFAITPVLRKPLGRLFSIPTEIEFGIGVGLLENRHFGQKDMGSKFQFEDRLGLRMQLTEGLAVSLRYMHYSNGGITESNPGLDFINVSFIYPL